MLRKFLCVCALAVLPAIAQAQPKAQDWEITLSGGGANNRGFTQAAFQINGSVGYFLTNEFELSLRQSVSYTDHNNGTLWDGSSRLAADYHFNLGKLQPFLGANIGYVYGDGISNTWEAAPEGGIKYYVHDRTFIQALVEYQFFFRNGGDADNGFKRGQFVYSLGVGFDLP